MTLDELQQLWRNADQAELQRSPSWQDRETETESRTDSMNYDADSIADNATPSD